MLSQSSRKEIVRRIGEKMGFEVDESNLSPEIRRAITNLAVVQKHLYVVTELLRGEQGRVSSSLVLRAASRAGVDSERGERNQLQAEMTKLQQEVDGKVVELAGQVTKEASAHAAGSQPPPYQGRVELVELKCPGCGASLPMPTGHLVRCTYCSTSLSVQEVSSQISDVIRSI